jgi:vacuolar iron transporter family protein
LAVTQDLSDVARKGAADEYTDYLVYKRLSESRRSSPKIREILAKLSEAEKRHYVFWSKYIEGPKPKESKLTIFVTLFLRFLFGINFAIRYLERHEDKVVKKYKSVSHVIPDADRHDFDSMLKDEEEHEDEFVKQSEGTAVKYISFIVLSLADAIVEISGIHAGSLGIYTSTELTGLAGIVAGASASIAMASAAYAQAKQGFQGSATVSAAFTGVSYFINAIVLATPYFLTKVMSLAIGTSLTLAIIIIAFISYYNSVISKSSFLRDFTEMAGIVLGASGGLFLFGLAIKSVLGITV